MTLEWLSEAAALAMHDELLVEHGGLAGSVNHQLLESTLARPKNLAAYGNPGPSLYELAASYGYGFARNHCFSDGNKRMALEAIDVFLMLNGMELTASEHTAVEAIVAVAAGEMSESDLAAWVEGNCAPLEEPLA